MTRVMATIGACSVVIIFGLLAATGANAQQQSGSDLSPAKSNCGPNFSNCANYSTGDVTNKNPVAEPSNATSASSDISPAKSNCGPNFATCANYPTGDQTKVNPAQQK